jgi:hypothetical protein
MALINNFKVFTKLNKYGTRQFFKIILFVVIQKKIGFKNTSSKGQG